jgi:hypothetical protein
MKNNKKWVNLTYIESILSKNWMNKNLGAQEKSGFIREAVDTKIKLDKKRIPKRNSKSVT